MSLRLPNNWEEDHAKKLFIVAKGEDRVRQIDHFRGDNTFNRPAAMKSVQEARELSISRNCSIVELFQMVKRVLIIAVICKLRIIGAISLEQHICEL